MGRPPQKSFKKIVTNLETLHIIKYRNNGKANAEQPIQKIPKPLEVARYPRKKGAENITKFKEMA